MHCVVEGKDFYFVTSTLLHFKDAAFLLHPARSVLQTGLYKSGILPGKYYFHSRGHWNPDKIQRHDQIYWKIEKRAVWFRNRQKLSLSLQQLIIIYFQNKRNYSKALLFQTFQTVQNFFRSHLFHRKRSTLLTGPISIYSREITSSIFFSFTFFFLYVYTKNMWGLKNGVFISQITKEQWVEIFRYRHCNLSLELEFGSSEQEDN